MRTKRPLQRPKHSIEIRYAGDEVRLIVYDHDLQAMRARRPSRRAANLASAGACRALALFVLFLAAPAWAATAFVSPQPGAQMLGLALVEVKTDAAAVDRVDFFVDGILAGASRTSPFRIAYDFGTAQNERTITAKVWTGGFRASETASVTTAGLTMNEKLDVYLVEVPVRVRSSRAVAPTDLHVTENGVAQVIRDVKRERPAAHFAFVVDRSLSMDGGRLEAALRAIQAEVRDLRAGDSASLVLFNHIVARAVPISKATDLLRHPMTSGGTSLRDALASTASTARTYAIVITDGGDRNSVLSDEAALRKISGTKTIVSAIVLGSSHTKFLDRATSNTGGQLMTSSAGSLAPDLSQLMDDLNSRYLVIYQSNGTQAGWRKVGVTAQRRGVQVLSARKEYFAE